MTKTILLLTLLSSLSGPSSAAEGRPNVIVMLTDDQGWADIGYNNPKVYTPNLDKLAAEGATFTQHYVMPQCTPTRIAFFTGRYPGRFGPAGLKATNGPVFPHGTFNVARLFKNAGYHTALIGKWHMGCSPEHGPNHHGFDYSYGALAGAVGNYDHRYRPNNPFEVSWHRNLEIIPGYENGTHTTDLVAQDAIRFLKKSHPEPFFLFLPFFAPHTPLDERGEFTDTPTQLDPDNPQRWLNEDHIPWFHDPDGKIQQEPDPEKRLFLAVLHHLDHSIGQIIAALDESGHRDNTLILFSSDNGPQVNWPGNAYPDDLKLTDANQPDTLRGSKTDTWEGGIHVPGFANWPAKISPGLKLDNPLHIIDWLPTLAALTRQSTPARHHLDGLNLLPLLLQETTTLPPRSLYWLWNTKPSKWALRHGDWKIVKSGKGEPKLRDWQLFNLKNDPSETTNLAKTHPHKVQALHQQFLIHRHKDRPK
ncbi:MAG: sulfatase-like hydrolase/transferase [Verrucomicrobiota bacterium]